MWLIDILWIFYNLALKRAIEMRVLAHRKTMMLSYWEIMRHQQVYKKFSSTILVPEKYMIVVLQLSTHVSQPSLLRISYLIQILRPWQSAKGARTGTNGKKQLRLTLTRLRREGY
jgi:hypothetical protein